MRARKTSLAALLFVLLAAAPLPATTFVVPDDGDFIAKSQAIVIGTVEGSYVNISGADAPIETVFEIRLERVLKGLFSDQQLLHVASPAGRAVDTECMFPARPHFVRARECSSS
jgi:hypothetical protein